MELPVDGRWRRPERLPECRKGLYQAWPAPSNIDGVAIARRGASVARMEPSGLARFGAA
jgi:hypothetical protein